MKILVSKCLLGEPCRYNGKAKKDAAVCAFLKDKEVIAVCPEVMGGMSIPHEPCERLDTKVIGLSGQDYSDKFLKGAKHAYQIATKEEVKLAILKSKSPSCGKDYIYDGHFNHHLREGHGLLTEMLLKAGVKVYREDELELLKAELLKELK